MACNKVRTVLAFNLFVTSKKMKPPIHEFKVLQNVF